MSDVKVKTPGRRQVKLIMAAPIGPPGPAKSTDVATLDELREIEPGVGRMRYVTDLSRPVWGDGEEWRTAEGYLADLSRIRITGTEWDNTSLVVHLNIFPGLS